MRSYLLFIITLLVQQLQAQQFQYDNVKYTSVYPEDLCRSLQEHPGYILLDVRSNGEFYDTSSSGSFNLGKLKNAVHIPVAELSGRIAELDQFKNKPLYIYCSHSQRSRRASKMLADSGFTKVYNINGGMTRILFMRKQMPGCFKDIYTHNLEYTILSPAEVMAGTIKENPFYIIDLRPDSVFRGISTYEKRNAMGYLKGSHNIFINELENNLSKIPRNKPILLVDEAGNESPAAAANIHKHGFKNINILFNGLDAWIDEETENGISKGIQRIHTQKYGLLSGEKFIKLAAAGNIVIIDLRNTDQFTNQSKNYWENIGSIKGAINIPSGEFDKTALLPGSKTIPVVLYSFSNQSDVFETAGKLAAMGYRNVYMLRGGIWNLRWAAYNLKGRSFLKDWIINVPEENR